MHMQEIVGRANEVRRLLDGTTGPIARIIAEHDVVFGVFPDSAVPDGHGLWIIKGRRRLKAIVASGQDAPDGAVRLTPPPAKMSWSAIPCECLEQAVAAGRVLGDGGGRP